MCNYDMTGCMLCLYENEIENDDVRRKTHLKCRMK